MEALSVDRPRFSVTVPAYNAQETLAETIESVRHQTYANWELVVVDDGSVDETLSIARRFAEGDPRVRVVSQQNRGPGGAFNTAVRHARADLLVFLAADDLLLPGHLEAFDAFVDAQPEGSVFTSGGFLQYPDRRRRPVDRPAHWAAPLSCSLDELIVACWFGVGAVYRREMYDSVGGFAEDCYCEDYLFWLRGLAHGCQHRYLDKRLAVHRSSSRQRSSNLRKMLESSVDILGRIVSAERLTTAQREVAQRRIARLKRRLRVDAAAVALLGPAGPPVFEGLRKVKRGLRYAGLKLRDVTSVG